MNNLKDILKSYTEDDYAENKINLHIHTVCSDGKGDAEQIIKAAKVNGYKLISITDHNTVEAHKTLSDEILITGVEFDCWFGYVFIHLLAYGIDINNKELQNFFSKDKAGTESAIIRLFTRRNVPDLIKTIHNAGGIAVLAHPACYWAINLEGLIKKLIELGLDGIETYYPYPRFRRFVKFHTAKKVLKIADKYPSLIKTGGSDFHGKVF